MKQIIQIVPYLAPAISGVGDYALLLAQQLRAAHDIHTTFVVCDPEWEAANRSQRTEAKAQTFAIRHPASDVELDGFPVVQLQQRTAAELVRVLSAPGMPATVLLQYVGYGYEKRGCPVWLARGLTSWKMRRNQKSESGKLDSISQSQRSACNRSAERRLVTMFHELYAFGPPWRSSFWVSPLQRWVAKTLACLSNECVANMNQNKRALQMMNRQREIRVTVLPVFSNVGEPDAIPEWGERAARMVVFGGAGWRESAYHKAQVDLEHACQMLNLREIVDIGTPCAIPRLSVAVVRLGCLSGKAVSEVLLNARAGFFTYPAHCLAKSGIFAAYAAHGLVPITSSVNLPSSADGLRAEEHYLTPAARSLNQPGCFAKVGSSARAWYTPHAAREQAVVFMRLLGPPC